MANCRQCGAELPSFTFGEASSYCRACRAQQVPQFQPQKTDALSSELAISDKTLATYALVAVNVLIFIVMVARGVDPVRPTTAEVLHWGADYGPYTFAGQYWRLFTAMFLHFGVIHLLGNMWCLWRLGRLAEKYLGPFTLASIYLLTGIGASILSLSWDPMRVSAGASGAIFGIAGTLITVLHYGRLNLAKETERKLLGYVVRFCLLNLLFGLQAHVDNMAHLGGMVTGLIAGFFLARTLNTLPEERPAQRRLVLVVCALALLMIFLPVAKAKQYAVDFHSGEVALDHQDPQKAVEYLKKYTAVRPDDAIGHAMLGFALHDLKRYDEAGQEYERSLSIEPDYPVVQLNLARIYYIQKKPDRAVVLFLQAIPKVNAGADDYDLYAHALEKTGDLVAAEDNARQAIRLDPKDIDAHELLADVLHREGKKDEAAAERHQILLLEPETPSPPPSN